VLAPFERIVQADRHGILPYQDNGFKVRNGTLSRIAIRNCGLEGL
jgi:hypothetical protein